jgi:hypothetical protein
MDNARQLVSVALQNAISCQLHQAYMKRVGHTSAADSFEGVPDSIDALKTRVPPPARVGCVAVGPNCRGL